MRRSLAAIVGATSAAVLCASALAQPPAAKAPPPGPAPVNAQGRVLLQGATPEDKGVWTPVFGTQDPIAPIETVSFKP